MERLGGHPGIRIWSAAAILALFASATLAWGFAEEHLHFLHPDTGEEADEEISTIHNDLTYALALAAGFTITDSRTLQIWNQLTDSEQLGPGEDIWYSNCGGAFSPTPDPHDRAVCARPGDYSQVAWPLWEQMQDAANCITSRFSPYSPFFHFPHQNARELGALHDWGWGLTDRLVGYEAYAWGAKTVMQATCRYTRTVEISTTIPAGSLEAFATYLHSLADSYSHRDCIAAMDSMGMPWATHTLAGCYECNYIPSHPTNSDAHGREFGSEYMHDSQRTDEAIHHVYRELVARGQQREGAYWPLDLDIPLTEISSSPTLSETLYAFVHNWNFDQPGNRRDYVDQLVNAILAQRRPMYRTCLPTVMKP